jgi:hypothetical protein
MNLITNNKKYFYLCVMAPLFLACLIYVSFRSEHILINLLLKHSFLHNIFSEYRKAISPLYALLPHCLYYSLPSALWLFSTLSFFLMLWKFNINRNNFYWFTLPLVYCIILEISQKIHFTDGTYDANDLIFYVLATLVFFLLNIKKTANFSSNSTIEKKHTQSAFTLFIFLGIVILSDCF